VWKNGLRFSGQSYIWNKLWDIPEGWWIKYAEDKGRKVRYNQENGIPYGPDMFEEI
jgi:hypothetical protein